MDTDVLVQLALLLFALSIFYILHTLPKRALSTLRSNSKSRPAAQANRHFIHGAQLLSRARSAKSKSAFDLAKSAADEADKAIALDPRDPAAYILKAMAETLMGRKAAALRSLDSALSPPALKMLSDREKGDALVKRAELQMGMNRKRRVESAVEDLLEAVRVSPDNNNPKAYLMLGECYEMKGMVEEAKKAFQEALRIDPTLTQAQAQARR